jgi:cell wall assembly regulator SMI1
MVPAVDRPRLLTADLLVRLEQRLIDVGAPIAQLWRPGLNDYQIDALTAEIGLSLPAEARIWWRWHDGVDQLPGPMPSIGGGWDPISLQDAIEDVVRQRKKAALRAQALPDDPTGDWSDSWITLCDSPSPARLACDCAVAPGSPSPVLYIDPEFNYDPYRPKAPSLGELIHAWLEALDDGTWHIDAVTGDFALLDPIETLAAKGPDIADLL